MEPWYKSVTPRKEVREGRSFNPGSGDSMLSSTGARGVE